jgi:diaminohydroxyphosphoribosylaminopyrimidine deaminase/5-amino-6-(5-phosphoribosylamino)uracil reductase
MDFIKYSLKLAKRAIGNTSPNPPVGAVVVKDNSVLAEGWTQPAGGPHAEIIALDLAGSKAKGATLFVSMEPCNYQGLTPPCTKAIIQSGIVEVYVAIIDKNPLINGNGIKELRDAGLKVHLATVTTMAEELVEAHNKFQLTGLPFITVKFAMSLDGKIATKNKDSKWITGAKARSVGHKLRQISDSIMVGVNTIVTDDPKLTYRDEHGQPFNRQPIRIIMDSNGRTPPDSQIFQSNSKILILTTDSG